MSAAAKRPLADTHPELFLEEDSMDPSLVQAHKKQASQQQLVPVVAEEDTHVVPATSTATLVEFNDEGDVAPRDFMDTFFDYARRMTPMLAKGVKTTDPNLALYVWCKAGRRNLHTFEFCPQAQTVPLPNKDQTRVRDKAESQVVKETVAAALAKLPPTATPGQIADAEEEAREEADAVNRHDRVCEEATRRKELAVKMIMLSRTEGKKKENGQKVGTGTFYTNLTTKAPQRWIEGTLPSYLLHMLAPFCINNYLRYGVTQELGVEGSRGRIIEGKVTPDDKSQYQFQLSNKSWTHLQQDEDYNNPVSTFFVKQVKELNASLLDKMVDPEMLPEIRKMYGKVKEPRPPMQEYMMNSGLYKEVGGEEESDPTIQTVGFGRSVFKKIGYDPETGEQSAPVPAPSQLFESCTANENGVAQCWNPLEVWRCRRAEEVEDGKVYPHPFIAVAPEDIYLTNKSVIAPLFHLTIYEWLMARAGRCNKPRAIIYLGEKDTLESLDRHSIQACDPRYAIPMAQPMPKPPKPSAGSVIDANGVSFMGQ